MNEKMDEKVVSLKLSDNVSIFVQATDLGGEQRVANEVIDFQEVADTVEAIADSLVKTFKKVQPQKASVEFGVKVAIKSGKLTTLLVEGSGEANLKIHLEWSER
ncbi:MAG: CU044_2847 family protein [Snowella sp.]|jgi:hypothetical protein|nr:CU044_2847 family protein [Snowella sp.]